MMLLKESMALLLMKKQTNEQTNKASVCTSFSFKMWSNRLSLFTFLNSIHGINCKSHRKQSLCMISSGALEEGSLKGENQSYNVIFTSQNQ